MPLRKDGGWDLDDSQIEKPMYGSIVAKADGSVETGNARVEAFDDPFDMEKNCGTGAGGFQPGNTCARGGDGMSEDEKESLKASGAESLLEEKTRAPADLADKLSAAQVARGFSGVATKVHDTDLLASVHKGVYEKMGSLKGQQERVVQDEKGSVHEREYQYENGRVLVRRDENGVEMHLYGRGANGIERDLGKFKMRDRRLDGTPDADKPPLTDWFYSGEADKGGEGAVEFSIYSRAVNSFWTDLHPGEEEFEDFLRDPFKSMTGGFKDAKDITEEERSAFMAQWQRAFDNAGAEKTSDGKFNVNSRFPAQNSIPERGSGAAFMDRGERLARIAGFKRVDNVPSWLNVVSFMEKNGYSYRDKNDEKRMNELKAALGAKGSLTKAQAAWLTLLQYAPEYGYNLPPDKHLGGAKMPLAIDHNLWMSKEL